MKQWLYVLAFIALVFGGPVTCNHYQDKARAERAARAEAECAASPECQDKEAARESHERKIVQSTTGALFWNGMRCTKDCSGHIAGYEWAEELAISDAEVCRKQQRNPSFTEGCIEAAERTYDAIREEALHGY